MEAGTKNRIGKALMIALVATGFMYITGREHYQFRSLHPAVGIVAAIFLWFLIALGALNLTHIFKTWRNKKR